MSGEAERGKLLAALQGQSVHVVGASGAEGSALLLHLAGELAIEGIVAHDFAPDFRAFARSYRRTNTAGQRDDREERLGRLRRLPVEFRLGDDYLRGLDAADFVLASQNWFNYPTNLPAIPDAVAAGAQLLGLVDLALNRFEGTRICITGSNGKSTTSALIRHLLSATSGDSRQILQGGNDRAQQVSLRQIEDADPQDLLIWEVSNRHLRSRGVASDIAVLTNITPNHIEDHGSWEAYVEAKLRLPLSVGASGDAILCGGDPVSVEALPTVRRSGCTLWVTANSEGGELSEGRCWSTPTGEVWLRRPGDDQAHRVAQATDLPLLGDHNRWNLQAALCAIAAAGADLAKVSAALPDFPALAGRLERVAHAAGVDWVYDIQATTAPAAAAGIAAVGESGRRILLIVGGDDKGMNYQEMAEQAATHADRILALPGSGTDAFLEALGERVGVDHLGDLDATVSHAHAICEAGQTVLLSPGCAFFHSRYIEAGPTFAQRVARQLERTP